MTKRSRSQSSLSERVVDTHVGPADAGYPVRHTSKVRIMGTATWSAPVTGLTCRGCVDTASKQLGEIRDIEGARIEIIAGGVSMVSVDATRELTDDEVAGALRAGGAFNLAR